MLRMDGKLQEMHNSIEVARCNAIYTGAAVGPKTDFGDYLLGALNLAHQATAPFYLAEGLVEGNTDFNSSDRLRVLVAAVGHLDPETDKISQVAEALQCDESTMALRGLETRKEINRNVRRHLRQTLVAANGVVIWRVALEEYTSRNRFAGTAGL